MSGGLQHLPPLPQHLLAADKVAFFAPAGFLLLPPQPLLLRATHSGGKTVKCAGFFSKAGGGQGAAKKGAADAAAPYLIQIYT